MHALRERFEGHAVLLDYARLQLLSDGESNLRQRRQTFIVFRKLLQL